MSRARIGRLAVAVLAQALLLAAGPAEATTSQRWRGELPLGRPSLTETRLRTEVASGVTHTRIVRGAPSKRDAWFVDVTFLAREEEARDLDQRLRADGFRARLDRVTKRAPDDPQRGPLGWLVRMGPMSSEAEANQTRDRMASAGYSGARVVFNAEDGGNSTGPWVVNVLEIVPERFDGSLAPALATTVVPGLERLTGIAARTAALAAVNGGYFVIGPSDGTPGDLAGISVLGSALVSEAVNGRTSLLLPTGDGTGAAVAALSSRQRARSSDGAGRLVDGLNRKPGLVRGCGGTGGDLPTEEPKHDFTCTDSSELILFTPAFGPSSEPGEGAEVALDADGAVLEVRDRRGGNIPPGGSVLSGTGNGAGWLRAHALVGAKIAVETQLLAEGAPVATGGGLGVVNGGPRLLRGGRVDITAAQEGFHWEERPEFYYRFGVRRNPRTLAGVTPEGHVLLVTVDGRQPGWSVGASFRESALIMQALGAADAVNLDGGGSTTMTVGSQLMTRPSDATGERTIADAIVVAAGSG